MYIEPNTIIVACKDIPLDTTYEHTIYFADSDAQETYFRGKGKYVFERNSYQRVQRGWMRVKRKAEDLYDCNYLMYRNTAFGDKWFYAFIKGVEYVNNEVSQIQFELDVMQTWMFDYELEQCFVEREHSSTDNYWQNLVPENLDCGEDVVSNGMRTFDMNDMCVCVLAAYPENQSSTGRVINNVYTPLRILAGVPASSTREIDALIDEYVQDGQEDRIVAIFQYPEFLGDASTSTAVTQTFYVASNVDTIDGYTPRNRKLYNYPYNFMLMSNNNGQTAVYKYENWDTESVVGDFEVAGAFVTTPCVMVYPTQYRGIESDYDSGLTISSFPQCAWVGDAFKAWWAQNRASVVTSGISSVLGTALTTMAIAGNPALGAPVTMGTTVTSVGRAAMAQGAREEAAQFAVQQAGRSAKLSASMQVKGVLAQVRDLQHTPPQIHGQTQTDSLNTGIGRVEFSCYKMSIKAEYARIIDDYFDRYRYATRRNKVPNTNVRPHWTYTKTLGCTIKGSIPCDDADAICAIYDNGITFWRNANEVGNYSLDNRTWG